MGEIAEVRPALFIVAAFSREASALDWARQWCESQWGPLALVSERFEFTETDYYARTMGTGLRKTFFALEQLIDPAELPERKLAANAAEQNYAAANPGELTRPLNLDPGYLTESKFVLASTKNHAHRLYLQQGIYAEITLRFRGGQWQPWEWTYPDYRRADFHAFFVRCRDYFRNRQRDASGDWVADDI